MCFTFHSPLYKEGMILWSQILPSMIYILSRVTCFLNVLILKVAVKTHVSEMDTHKNPASSNNEQLTCRAMKVLIASATIDGRTQWLFSKCLYGDPYGSITEFRAIFKKINSGTQ